MAPIRICTIMPDPAAEEARGASQASGGIDEELAQFVASMAIDTDVKWEPGQTLRIRFLGGSPRVQKMVKKYAKVWLKYANLKMNFVRSGDADIRVSFNKGGSWSMIGTKCRNIGKDKPTMNFGWFTDKTAESEFSRTVTHEFGHALGCIHEHQSPAGNIPWKKSAVYAYYKKTQGWDRATVRTNIFKAYSVDSTQFSSFDKKSIMLYTIPSSLTTNGYSTTPNKVLSRTDKRFIAKAYPRPSQSASEEDSGSATDYGSDELSDSDESDDSETSEDSEEDSEDSEDSESEEEMEDPDLAKRAKLETAMNGRWRGFYFYVNGMTDGESKFTLSTSRVFGANDVVNISGNGWDPAGSFYIQGRANTAGNFTFNKMYPNYTWVYSGRLNPGRRTIEGIWGGGRGSFAFVRG